MARTTTRSRALRFSLLLTGFSVAFGTALSQGDERDLGVSAAMAGSPEARPSLSKSKPGWECDAAPSLSRDALQQPHWSGWGIDLENSRYQPAEHALLRVEDLKHLKVRWVWGFPEASTIGTQPAIVGGRVFIGSPENEVLSLDAKTGCLYWRFMTEGSVRATPSVVAVGSGLRLFVADRLGFVYAVDASDGTLVWKILADDHRDAIVTASPVVHQGRVYVGVSSLEEPQGLDPDYECCTFRGSVVALDALTGAKVWKTHMIADEPQPTWVDRRGVQRFGPSGAGIWSAATIDPKVGALYVTTGDAYSHPAAATSDAIVALDLQTGRILWSVQTTADDVYTLACHKPEVDPNERCGPDFDYGASAVLRALPTGRRVLLAGQKSGVLHALDPDRGGKILWKRQLSEGGVLGGIEWGFAADAETAYVPISDLWKKNPNEAGGVFAVRTRDGKIVWHAPAPVPDCVTTGCSGAQPQAATLVPGILFSGSIDEHILAYDPATGEIIWDFDTKRDFETVNDVRARGGSLNGAGATVVDGWVYFTSGYAQYGIPGNVLLALGPATEVRD